MDFSKQKRILVTGGAGLIGSGLCARLLAQGHDVVCLDNFSTGSKRNIYALLKEPGFELIRQDVQSPLSLKVDEIYHLACPASRRYHRLKPLETAETCILGSIRMLQLASRLQAKILFASTGQVPREQEQLPPTAPLGGNTASADPEMFYREANRCAETLFFGYHIQHRLNIRIARLFNAFGPAMQAESGSVVACFIARALEDQDLTIHGDGSQTRPLCFVDDIVEGLLRFMNSPDDFIGPLDLGNFTEISVFDLAQTVIRLSGSRSGIIFQPLRQDEPFIRRPYADTAHRRLNWHPSPDITNGLKRTIEYFRTFYDT
jgi:UDP-glucuronate decarboxylase